MNILYILYTSYIFLNYYTVSCIKDLYLMGFTSVTGRVWPGGGAIIPAFDMAIRDINNRSDILSDYRLNLLMKDTQCDAGRATDAMYEFLYTPPVKHMIIGPVCSVEAEVQAQAAHMWNISHLSNGAASPVLSDRSRFPNFFRINPPDTRYNLARIEMLKHFNWKRVGTINVALDMYSAVSDDLADRLKDTDIHIASQEIFDGDPFLRIQNLKDKDIRIIFSMSYENQARLILCAAYRVGLFGHKILWFFPGWYKDYWWRDNLENVPCTQDQMDEAAEGHFLTGIYFKNQKEERGIAGMTVSEFYARLNTEPSYSPDYESYEFMATPSFDGIWAAALALNCTDTIMKERGHTKTLDEFQYADNDIGDIILSCIYKTSFLGLAGNVFFDRAGESLRNIKIEQIRGLERFTVGTYVLEEEERYIKWHGDGIIWRGGMVPRDSTEVVVVEKTIPMYLYIIMAALSTGGIILAISLFIFNIRYRNHEEKSSTSAFSTVGIFLAITLFIFIIHNWNHVYVKLSSPTINNVLLLGCALSYSPVYLTTYGEQTETLCKMKHVTFTIGFTVAFGAMFSKTWRVYRIFCNKKLIRVKIQDSQLIAIVLGMLAVVTTILIIWEIVDPLYIRTLFLENEEYTTGNDVTVRPYMRDCMSDYYDYFLWTICIVEGLFLAFGAFLAFETRKVKIEALNDSRLIGMCLYNVVILSLLGLTLSLLLDSQVALVYGLSSGFLILGTTITQLIVFVPKIHGVLYPHAVAPTGDETGPGTVHTSKFESKIGTTKKLSSAVPSTSR